MARSRFASPSARKMRRSTKPLAACGSCGRSRSRISRAGRSLCYNACFKDKQEGARGAMYEAFLVPEITVEANGESAPLTLGAAAGKPVLLTLAITGIVEQESLDASIFGSANGTEWAPAPLT